jgi:hypothetical protein
MLFAATKTAIFLTLATALHAQTAPDPAETLSEARLKISAAMRNLPKYLASRLSTAVTLRS